MRSSKNHDLRRMLSSDLSRDISLDLSFDRSDELSLSDDVSRELSCDPSRDINRDLSQLSRSLSRYSYGSLSQPDSASLSNCSSCSSCSLDRFLSGSTTHTLYHSKNRSLCPSMLSVMSNKELTESSSIYVAYSSSSFSDAETEKTLFSNSSNCSLSNASVSDYTLSKSCSKKTQSKFIATKPSSDTAITNKKKETHYDRKITESKLCQMSDLEVKPSHKNIVSTNTTQDEPCSCDEVDYSKKIASHADIILSTTDFLTGNNAPAIKDDYDYNKMLSTKNSYDKEKPIKNFNNDSEKYTKNITSYYKKSPIKNAFYDDEYSSDDFHVNRLLSDKDITSIYKTLSSKNTSETNRTPVDSNHSVHSRACLSHFLLNMDTANEDKIVKTNILKVKSKFKDKATNLKPHREPKYAKNSSMLYTSESVVKKSPSRKIYFMDVSDSTKKIESAPVTNTKDVSTNEITSEIIKIDRGDGSYIKQDEIFAIYRQQNRTNNEEHANAKVNKTDNKAKKENDKDDKKEGEQKIIKKQFKIIRKCFKPLMHEQTSGKVVCKCLKSQQKSKMSSAESVKEICLQLNLPLCKKCFKPKQTNDEFFKHSSIRFCECKYLLSELNQEAKLNPCESQASASKTKKDSTTFHVESTIKVKPDPTPKPLLNKSSVIKCKCLKKRTLLESVLCKYTKKKTKLGKTICADCTCEKQSSEIETNAAVTLSLATSAAEPMYRPGLDFEPKLKSILQPKSLPNPEPKQGLAHQHIKSMESVFLSSLSLGKLVSTPQSDLEFKPELAPRNVDKIEAKLDIPVSKCCLCKQLLPDHKTEIKPNQTSELNSTSKLKSNTVTKTASKIIPTHIIEQAAVSSINLVKSDLVVAKANSKQLSIKPYLDLNPKVLKPELITIYKQKSFAKHEQGSLPDPAQYRKPELTEHLSKIRTETNAYLNEENTKSKLLLQSLKRNISKMCLKSELPLKKTICIKCLKAISNQNLLDYLTLNNDSISKKTLTHKSKRILKVAQALESRHKRESKLEPETKLGLEPKPKSKPKLESTAKLQSKSKVAFEDKIESKLESLDKVETKAKEALDDKLKSKLESVTKVESKPKVGSEAKVESRQKVGPEAKVESKQKVGSEAKIESKPKVGSEAKIESRQKVGSQAKVESKLKVGSETRVELNPKVGPDTRVQSKLEIGLEAKVESKPKLGSEAKAESKPKAGSEALVESKPKVGPEARVQSKSKVGSEAKIESKSKVGPDTRIQSKPQVGSKAKIESKSKVGSQAKVESKSKLEPVLRQDPDIKSTKTLKPTSKVALRHGPDLKSTKSLNTSRKLDERISQPPVAPVPTRAARISANIFKSKKHGTPGDAVCKCKQKLGKKSKIKRQETPGATICTCQQIVQRSEINTVKETKRRLPVTTLLSIEAVKGTEQAKEQINDFEPEQARAEVEEIEPGTPAEAVETPAGTPAAGSDAIPVVTDEELSPYCTHCEENKVICKCYPPQSEYCKKCGHILKLVCECYGEKIKKKNKTKPKGEEEPETNKAIQDADVNTEPGTESGKKPKFMTDGLSEMISGFKVNVRKKREVEKQTKPKAGEWSLEDALRYVAHTNPELLTELLPVVAKDNKIEGICMPQPKDGEEFPRAILEEPVPTEYDLSDENEEHVGIKMTKLPYTRRRRRR